MRAYEVISKHEIMPTEKHIQCIVMNDKSCDTCEHGVNSLCLTGRLSEQSIINASIPVQTYFST